MNTRWRTSVQSLSILAMMWTCGCAQVMCVKQPKPFTPNTLQVGTSRVVVLGELGHPLGTEEQNGKMTETFVFVDGGGANLIGWKIARLIGYTVGDLCTLWLDQLIWIPLEEFALDGTTYRAIVEYEKSQNGSWLIKTAPVISETKMAQKN